MRQYVISLKRGIDCKQFWYEMENTTQGLSSIPDRAVDVVEDYDDFDRLCGYALTDYEAIALRQDPRVAAVEIPFSEQEGVKIMPFASQNNDFTKPVNDNSGGANENLVNWGLVRHSNPTNVYGVSTSTDLPYRYTLNGGGIDLVISDSGIQGNHPEFQYIGNSTSRVQSVNWASYEPALATMPNPLQDPDGHGTNVAGIAAGKTYGWAKGALIYSIVATGTGSPDPIDQFRAILRWHRSKTSNRPTVVNMSWGLVTPWQYLAGLPPDTPANLANLTLATNLILSRIIDIQWRSGFYPPTNVTTRGLLLDPSNIDCLYSLANNIPARNSAVDTALGSLIDAGIIVVRSAGNSSYKIDKSSGGTGDFNNNFLLSSPFGLFYYNRGSSPTDTLEYDIDVGSLDSVAASAAQDQKAKYSCSGPGVDIYAAGTKILSASTSNTAAPEFSQSASYFLDNSFRQINLTGTSMASPQVAGMICLYLQAQPVANIYSVGNSLTVKSWVTGQATNTMYSPGNSTSYTDFRSTLGGSAKVSYQNIQGLTQIKTGLQTWKPVKSVLVKNNVGTWTEVKNIWVKDGEQWKPVYTDPT